MSNIVNRVFRLKNKIDLKLDGYKQILNFKDGEEFHIVNNVLYMGGHPLPPELQNKLVKWIKDNPVLFVDDTRKFRDW